MKNSLTFVVLLMINTNAIFSQDKIKPNEQRIVAIVDQIDSFKIYYQELKLILKKNPYDTSLLTRTAVKYMENETKIKAHADGNYFGWFLFTKNDLIAWKSWKRNNK